LIYLYMSKVQLQRLRPMVADFHGRENNQSFRAPRP
jgi:hypothetical protein